MLKRIIWKFNYVVLESKTDFDKCKSGGLHEENAVATWNLGKQLRICLKTEENQEDL
jgi:hypothetical protein